MTTDFATAILQSPGFWKFLGVVWDIIVLLIPVLLALISWRLWVHYVQRLFIYKMKWVTLQVKVPKEVFKTPQAMEFFFVNALYQAGGTKTLINRFWEGKVRTWFSLGTRTVAIYPLPARKSRPRTSSRNSRIST